MCCTWLCMWVFTCQPCQDTGAILPRFPLDPTLTFEDSLGLKIEWNTSVTTFGGEFRMCWCADSTGSNSTDCRLTANFLVDFGRFSLIGPYLGQLERTCVSGQTCYIDGFSGALAGSLMVLETCGVLTPSSSLLTADGIFSISTSELSWVLVHQ